jgi:DNA-binding MarR family transcriptional regulator
MQLYPLEHLLLLILAFMLEIFYNVINQILCLFGVIIMARTKINDKDLEQLSDQIRSESEELRGDLFLLFVRTTDVFNRHLDFELSKTDANRTDLAILHNLITHNGSLSPTDLADKAFRSKHAITRAVDNLEKEGLVKRYSVKGDRRRTEVSITKKGLDSAAAKLETRGEMIERTFSCLNQKQIRELKAILKKLKAHLLTVNPVDYNYIRNGITE